MAHSCTTTWGELSYTVHGHAADERDADERDSRPAVLLLHSLGTSADLWRDVIPGLAGERLIVPDLLGHGSSVSVSAAVSVVDHAAAALALLDDLGERHVAVVGCSLGALIAIELAAAHPERITRVVLNGCPGWSQESDRMARFEILAKKILPSGLPDLDLPAMGAARATGEEYRQRRRTDLEHAGADYAHALRAVATYDLTPRLPHVACRALVLMGDQDVHLRDSGALISGLADAQLMILTDTGHLSPYDVPQEMAAEISSFLAG